MSPRDLTKRHSVTDKSLDSILHTNITGRKFGSGLYERQSNIQKLGLTSQELK
jgi:hypothetical protein